VIKCGGQKEKKSKKDRKKRSKSVYMRVYACDVWCVV
jgi:hypothetical protein